MSGGAYNYAEFRLEDIAEFIERGGRESDQLPRNDVLTPTRKRIGSLLRTLAEAVHEVEWADSGDTSPEYAVLEVEKILGGIIKHKVNLP